MYPRISSWYSLTTRASNSLFEPVDVEGRASLLRCTSFLKAWEVVAESGWGLAEPKVLVAAVEADEEEEEEEEALYESARFFCATTFRVIDLVAELLPVETAEEDAEEQTEGDGDALLR